MKTPITLLTAIAIIFASCGNKDAENKKKAEEGLMKDAFDKYSKAVDDYCLCLQSKTLEECTPEHDQLFSEYQYVNSMIDSQLENGEADAEKIKEYRSRSRELFDKKAACAQDKLSETSGSDTLSLAR